MQKISMFWNNSYCIWIDLSKQKKCIWVFDIKDDQIEKLKKWCNIEIIDWKIEIIETDLYIETIKTEKISEIKKQCSKAIIEKYPTYKQINMWADIQEIHLIARAEERIFTNDEMIKVWEWKEMKEWIQTQRDECNQKIAEL